MGANQLLLWMCIIGTNIRLTPLAVPCIPGGVVLPPPYPTIPNMPGVDVSHHHHHVCTIGRGSKSFRSEFRWLVIVLWDVELTLEI